MKKIFSVLLLTLFIFSLGGCALFGANIEVENGAIEVSGSYLTTKIVLVGNEEKDITDDGIKRALLEAIDGKTPDDSYVYTGEICDCEIKYIIRIIGTYPKGYYLSIHDHGIEISAYCKFRKCMELIGIVELDEETVSELIGMLESMED